MIEETKEVVRLLFECMDALRKHDKQHMLMDDIEHLTDPDLKKRLREYLKRNNLDNPEFAVQELNK